MGIMEINTRAELPKLLKYFNLPIIGVEVGVAQASNAIDMLKNGLEHIYLVDNWGHIENTTGDGNFPEEFHEENYKIAIENLNKWGFNNKYTILKGLSSQMHRFIDDNSVGLIYIDGFHSYEGCKQDIENYFGKLVKNGIIAFHDFYNEGYGVRQAVEEFADFKGLKINKITEHSNDDNHASVWIQI